ncbi:MAG TPA: hypothetical protein VM008_06140 [Phycisphaerae bacterium]|nr:hypothetical protein [Phycisphaerae bacterium]
MPDHRVVQNGVALDFSCQNKRFRTNTGKGKPHGSSKTLGSVTESPIYQDGPNTLWLEHVKEGDTEGIYWLMWYKNGWPSILESAVFDRDSIHELLRQLATVSEEIMREIRAEKNNQ